MADFDAIVVGSGITGGWAAKELTERGLKVLMIERGPELQHRTDYTHEQTPPWELPFRGYADPAVLQTTKRIQRVSRANEWTLDYFVDDDVDIYETPPESDFKWIRGYHTGGKSVMWGRHCYRLGEENFTANAKDGHGVDWPIRYKDLAPWYDHVEQFIGVNGTVENLPSLPDGKYQPSMGMNAAELRVSQVLKAHYKDRNLIPGRTANLTQAIGDRQACFYRNQCMRGCSFGSYFSTQSSTLPAALATGRLSQLHNAIVASVVYDAKTKRATGVNIIDAKTGQKSVQTARIIFVCANAFDSVALLQRSVSATMPKGLGNSNDMLGRYIMDHAWSVGGASTVPGIENAMYLGRKPNGAIIPRFVNVGKQETDFYRGYSFQGGASRQNWNRGGNIAGVGAGFKQALRQPGDWTINLTASVETLPRPDNRVTVNFNRHDKYGLPVTRIDMRYSDNERKAAAHALKELTQMFSVIGGRIVNTTDTLGPPGTSIHDMGGACMGNDPKKSVVNAYNQVHDAPNVFVTDGSSMCSTGDRNPSLSFMALTARASANAVSMLKENRI